MKRVREEGRGRETKGGNRRHYYRDTTHERKRIIIIERKHYTRQC